MRSTREKQRYSYWQKIQRIRADLTASQKKRIFCIQGPYRVIVSREPVMQTLKRLLSRTTQVRQKVRRPKATRYLTELLQKMNTPSSYSPFLVTSSVQTQKYQFQLTLRTWMVWLSRPPGKGLQKLLIEKLLAWLVSTSCMAASQFRVSTLLAHQIRLSPPICSDISIINLNSNRSVVRLSTRFPMFSDSLRRAGSDREKSQSGQLLDYSLQRSALSKKPRSLYLALRSVLLLIVVCEDEKNLQFILWFITS